MDEKPEFEAHTNGVPETPAEKSASDSSSEFASIRPHSSIKSRHSSTSFSNFGSESSHANVTTGSPKSAKSLSPKKAILLTSGVFVVAFVAMVVSIVVPMIMTRFFPPKWVADFRSAYALSHSNWKTGQSMMLAAIAEGQRLNAPEELRMTQFVYYAQSLQEHGEPAHAAKIFHDVSVMAARNRLWEKQGLALIYESDCEHDMFWSDRKRMPDLQPALTALAIFEKSAPDKSKEGFAAYALGKLYWDLGNAQQSEYYFRQVESLWSNDHAQQALVTQTRWRLQMETIVSKLEGKPFEPKCKASDIELLNSDSEQDQAVRLLSTKDFGSLEKLFAQTRIARRRQSDCSEETDYLLFAVSGLQSKSDDLWKGRQCLLQDWCKHSPRSATPYIVLACFYNNYAQSIESRASEKKVQDSSGDEARKCLTQIHLAAVALGKALELGPVTPEWFYVAQMNILCSADKSARNLFEKLMKSGSSAFPDYMPIYINYATSLEPCFYGTNEEWLNYVTGSANKFDGLDGDRIYAVMVERAQQHNEKLAAECPGISWERVRRGTGQPHVRF